VPSLSDGRYEGGNGDLFVELRIDQAGAAAISGDVYSARSAPREYLASVRTDPDIAVRLRDGSWPAVWQSRDGVITPGTLAVGAVPGDSQSATLRLRLGQQLDGLPAGADVLLVVRWAGPEFRHLGVESENEASVRLPGAVQVNGTEVTFRECLRQAGLAVSDVGETSRIPARIEGWRWDDSNVFSVLNDLMRSTAQAGVTGPAWQVHLLNLSRSTRDGVYGIMFDLADSLPRQGCAVFVEEIRGRVPAADQDRKIIQTTVHELGHTLNLAHRFERLLGRADSTSFMNYDWRYRGGGRIAEFWQRFDYQFDPDELAFLRHAPRSAVMPGSAPFHSVNYWGAAPADSAADLPEPAASGFELSLQAPASGRVFAFGQPVFLQVTLRNSGQHAVTLPANVLDIKAGSLEILVQKYSGVVGARRLGGGKSFVPMLQRCVDLTPAPKPLQPGDEWRDNVNISFGASGFTMADPGTYRLTPLLTVAGNDDRGEPVSVMVSGEPLIVKIAQPRSRREEKRGTTLLRPDVGAWFALGGSAALADARAVLEEIAPSGRKPTRPRDPVESAVARSLGIHASRPYLRFRDGAFVRQEEDTELAATVLGDLAADVEAMRYFDDATAQTTRDLARSLQDKTGRDKTDRDKTGRGKTGGDKTGRGAKPPRP